MGGVERRRRSFPGQQNGRYQQPPSGTSQGTRQERCCRRIASISFSMEHPCHMYKCIRSTMSSPSTTGATNVIFHRHCTFWVCEFYGLATVHTHTFHPPGVVLLAPPPSFPHQPLRACRRPPRLECQACGRPGERWRTLASCAEWSLGRHHPIMRRGGREGGREGRELSQYS